MDTYSITCLFDPKGICVKCRRSFATQREQLQLATRRDDIEEIAVGLTEFSLVRQCRVCNTQLNAQTTKEQTPLPRCTLLLGHGNEVTRTSYHAVGISSISGKMDWSRLIISIADCD